MPKLKTHKGIQKRFKITGTGKLMRMHQGKSHLRIAKSKRVKRSYDKMEPMSTRERKKIMRLIPYGV
jgi:large subunit ribosomal protein L35